MQDEDRTENQWRTAQSVAPGSGGLPAPPGRACPHCGARIKGEARLCPACGAPLAGTGGGGGRGVPSGCLALAAVGLGLAGTCTTGLAFYGSSNSLTLFAGLLLIAGAILITWDLSKRR